MSKKLPDIDSEISNWYTDVVTKAGLADYGPVKGTMVIKPYGFQLWENVKDVFDGMIKKTGHVNAYFPLLIPKSFLAKEAEHVDGFAKECAVVTHTRLKSENDEIVVDPDSRLEEEVIIRPTSETVIWSMYKKWIQSYRDLPILINQWANVVRWEMRTRLFLRTTEFLWQEGHTAHKTKEEAQKETLDILDLYKRLAEEYLAIPVYTGLKTDAEKFAGADKTYCIEAMMLDKRALQAGTSHNLGQNFAKAFDVKFQTEDNNEEYVWATSWGISTRLIGAVILAHGDKNGLRIPPKIAPIQTVLIPIFRDVEQRELVEKYITSIEIELKQLGIRYFIDWSDSSPGFKFNEWELKGVPLRIEIGPKDIENGSVVFSRRDGTDDKFSVPISDISKKIDSVLEDIQINMLDSSRKHQEDNTVHVSTKDELIESLNSEPGFVTCYWHENSDDENEIKELTKATLRCYLLDSTETDTAVNDSSQKGNLAIFSKAY